MKFFASLALALLLLPATPLHAEKPAATDTKAKKEATPDKKKDSVEPAVPSKKKDKEEAKKKDATEAEFDMPVQIGSPVKKIKIPQYDKDGKLQMLFDAELATKVDDTHIEMENLKIEASSDDGKKFYIELPRAVFNLETRVMNGQSRVFIRREDFEINGDSGEFHIKTRNAKIFGNVKMIILNTESFDKP